MSKKLIVLGFVFGIAVTIAAQEKPPSTLPAACEKVCSIPSGLCHLQRASYLLHGRQDSIADCVRSDIPALDALALIPQTLLGIQELDSAIANPSGVTARLIDLRFEQAGARIALAHLYLREGDINGADRAMKEAGTLYLSLFEEERRSAAFTESGPKIAAGLLRCGMATEALRVLSALPAGSSGRAYLSAEALFSLEDRQAAAQSYEQWIASGCQYDVVMLLDDQYGRRWTLLLQSKPLRQTRCEQMPQELRSRLETLNEAFHHPNNLPAQSYPGVLFPARADY
jgi:hypothetical protein